MKKNSACFLLLNAMLLPTVSASAAGARVQTRQDVINQRLSVGQYSKYQALKYQVMARENPELLPEELRNLPNSRIKSATALHKEIFFALNDPELDEDTRAYLAEAEASNRPEITGTSFVSTKYPLRVHYSNISYSSVARDVLSYAEYSWQREVEDMGFLAPLPDTGHAGNEANGNIDEYYDIYITSSAGEGAAGYTAPEGYYTETDNVDCYSYIVIGYTNSSDLRTTVAHELNHAMQMAYDCMESSTFFENTSTYVMDLVYPEEQSYIGYLPDFQQYPYMGFYTFSYETVFQYGGMLVAKLLDEAFGTGDGTFLRSVWERTPQTSVKANEPHYLDAIDAALQDKAGVGLDEFQAMLTEWRFFTGERDDGKHFKDAGDWPSGGYIPCDVAIDSVVNLDESKGIVEGQNKIGVQPLGSSYIKINLSQESSSNLSISFGGGYSRWAAQLICHNSSSDDFTVAKLLMDSEKKNGNTIFPITGYDYCFLAVSYLGNEGFNPDKSSTKERYFYYQVSLVGDSMPLPEVTTLSANLMNCLGGQELVLQGSNFYSGMQVLINGVEGQVIEQNSDGTEIRILTPKIATSGNYEVSVTAPDRSLLKVGTVLYYGDGCSCACNKTEACDDYCECDPECLYCACDVDTGCSADCRCDPECTSCGCSAANEAEEKANFGWFLASALILGGYFAIRRRLNHQRAGRN